MGRSSSARRKKSKWKRFKQPFILIVLIASLTGGYYYLETHGQEEAPIRLPQEENKGYVAFENNDPENNLEVVMYYHTISINTIAETFYNSEIFWPYIYMANKQVIPNPVYIQAETLLKIPRLPEDLLDLSNPRSISKVEHLADSILDAVKEST